LFWSLCAVCIGGQDVAVTPRPLDDSVYLQHRDEIITSQKEQIEMLTARVSSLMGGIDKVEDQVTSMQTQVFSRDEAYAKMKVRSDR
jgi:hypothetical protein